MEKNNLFTDKGSVTQHDKPKHKERNILVTVGTSLYKNEIPNDKNLKTIKDKLKNLESLIKSKVGSFLNFTEPEELNEFKKVYNTLNLEDIIKRRMRKQKDFLAAEISSLFLFYYKYIGTKFEANPNNIPPKEKKDNIYLICSDSAESICCGMIILDFLNKKNDFSKYINIMNIKNNLIRIDDLKLDDKEEFKDEGIENFIKQCSEKLQEGDIVNISGGYKMTGPYMTILSMCVPNTRAFYLHETAYDILELPRLAIDMDILKWRDYRGITAILSKLHPKNIKLENLLPSDSIRGLFNKNFTLNKFGKMLKERYDEYKDKRITEFGTGFILSDRLKKMDKASELGEYMENLITNWQHLWVGDTLRETAEHSRGHVQRLQEIAAQILFQIFEHDRNFLPAEDLFKLICAIWLHDIGHSSETFELNEKTYVFPGFPTITRDLHHFISASLIEKEKEDIFKYRFNNKHTVEEKNKMEEFSKNIISKNINDIIEICRYHRKDMPSNNFKGYCIGCDKQINAFSGNMKFLISLFSLIDESDVQSERAFPENYRLWREQQNKREEAILCQQFENYFNALNNKSEEIKRLLNSGYSVSNNEKLLYELAKVEANRRVLATIEHMFGIYFSTFWESTQSNDNNLKNTDKAVEKKIIKLFKEGFFDKNKPLKEDEIIYREILSIINRFLFKKRQPAHFEKHKGVLSVGYILQQLVDKKFKFDIYLTFSEESGSCQEAAKDIYTQYYLRKEFLNKKQFYLNPEGFHFMNIDSSEVTIWKIKDVFEDGVYKPEIVQKNDKVTQ
jgi:HD-GYP domain-containing protein (c-di-GMP phosphodiesterase class II)